MPSERILLETDAPDALPKSASDSLYLVEGDSYNSKELQPQQGIDDLSSASDASTMPKETLNHPANILNVSLHRNRFYLYLFNGRHYPRKNTFALSQAFSWLAFWLLMHKTIRLSLATLILLAFCFGLYHWSCHINPIILFNLTFSSHNSLVYAKSKHNALVILTILSNLLSPIGLMWKLFNRLGVK